MIAKMCVKSNVISVRPNWLRSIDKEGNSIQSLSATYQLQGAQRLDYSVQDFGYVCTVTLTFEKELWIELMTHPSIMDSSFEKYYTDPIWQQGIMA